MKDDLQRYLPTSSALRKVADEKAAKERMREAVRDRPTPAMDPPVSGRRKLPRWLMPAGALAAVLVPTSVALIVGNRLGRDTKEPIAAPSMSVQARGAPSAGSVGVSTGSPAVSAAPAPSVSATASAEPKQKTQPKKTMNSKDAGATAPIPSPEYVQ